MPLRRKLVFGYLAIVSTIFLMGYVVLGFREMGLYLFLIALDLPSSLVVVPQMESLSESLGWVLGRPSHILPTQPREDLYQLAQSSLKDDLGGAQPQKEQVEHRYQTWITHEWFNWWRNLVLLGVSILAAGLALARKRWGLWLVIGACAYVLAI